MGNESKVLTRPALLLAVLGLVVIGAGTALLHEHQQNQARASAATEAKRLAATLAGDLRQRVNRQREQLEQAASQRRAEEPSTAPLTPGPWNADTRLLIVPDGHPGEAGLSFTLRELLQRLRESGEVVISSRGGEKPALFLARTVPGGALILEHNLTPWRKTLDQRFPPASAFTLGQDNLTLMRHGQSGADAATATARGGPFTVTLLVTPTPPPWQSLLIPAAIGAVAVLFAVYAAFALLARRRPAAGPESRSSTGARPSADPGTDTKPDRPVAPPPPPEPEPPPEPQQQAAPEPGPAPPAALFSRYGIRATAGAPLDDTALEQLGRAVGSEAAAAGQHTLFVAHGAQAGEGPARALIQGLTACGRQVLDLGLAPPAALYYATAVLESQSGVCLSGDGTDLDIVINGEPLYGERLTALRQRLLDRNLDDGDGAVESREISGRYLNAIADDIILARPMSVAVQGPNAAGALAPTLFDALGCKAVVVDGADPNELATAVADQKLNLGLAFPAHGGLSLVTTDGEHIAADRLLMLFARDLLDRNPGADVLFDVKCSRALASLIRKQGGRPVMDRSAPPHLHARMRELAAPLAGGASGHIFFADRWYGFSDALYAAARLLEILSLQQGDSAEVFAALRTGAVSPEWRIDAGERGTQIMTGLLDRAERFPGGRANTLDGLRVDFPDGWGLVGEDPDNSAALLARFEGRDAQALERVQALFREQFQAVDGDLKLPF